MAPMTKAMERVDCGEVVLQGRLRAAFFRLNPTFLPMRLKTPSAD